MDKNVWHSGKLAATRDLTLRGLSPEPGVWMGWKNEKEPSAHTNGPRLIITGEYLWRNTNPTMNQSNGCLHISLDQFGDKIEFRFEIIWPFDGQNE